MKKDKSFEPLFKIKSHKFEPLFPSFKKQIDLNKSSTQTTEPEPNKEQINPSPKEPIKKYSEEWWSERKALNNNEKQG